jgi:hypothetical protein
VLIKGIVSDATIVEAKIMNTVLISEELVGGGFGFESSFDDG